MHALAIMEARKYVWILGAPLCGKTTSSGLIAGSVEHGRAVEHVSVGKLIRETTEHRDVINECFLQGKLIPPKLCFDILKNHLDNLSANIKLVILDGYPRSRICFETWRSHNMPWPSLILHYTCSVETLRCRLAVRSGAEIRIDDTVEIFQKRYEGYCLETLELLKFLKGKDEAPPCKTIDADRILPEVLDKVHYYPCRYDLCGCLTS